MATPKPPVVPKPFVMTQALWTTYSAKFWTGPGKLTDPELLNYLKYLHDRLLLEGK